MSTHVGVAGGGVAPDGSGRDFRPAHNGVPAEVVPLMPAHERIVMSAFLLSTALIFVAELGDKSQLVALWFATRYRWWVVLSGVTVATLVVAVFVLLRALARGIEASSGNTGDPRNILVVRQGSQAESGSLVNRDHFRTIQFFEEVAHNERDEPVISAEVVLIVNAPRIDGTGDANTLLRGITPRGIELRPQVRLVDGRWFTVARREVVVSRRLAARFAGFNSWGRAVKAA